MQALFSELRPNVVFLVLIAALTMFALSATGVEIPESVIGGFVGGVIVIAGRLLDPPPEPSVPVSALSEILEKR